MGIELSTDNSGTLPGFYDDKGRIQNPSDAQDLANLEAKLEKQHIEKTEGLEFLEGGYLDVFKPIYEQNPNLFNVLKDSRGESVLISEFLEGGSFGGYGGNGKAIIAWPDVVAVIIKAKPVTPEEKDELSSLEPEILTKWNKELSEVGMGGSRWIEPGSGSLDLNSSRVELARAGTIISIRPVMNKTETCIASRDFILPLLSQLDIQLNKMPNNYKEIETKPLQEIMDTFVSSQKARNQ